MNTFRTPPRWAVVFILLLLLNLAWMFWNLRVNVARAAAAKSVRITLMNTNHVSGILVYEADTGQPLWARFREGETRVSYTLFYDGKDVFHIVASTNQPPKYGVYFRGEGEAATWWIDRGGGSFTERVTYDKEGIPISREVWYQEAWYPVERRDQRNGIIVGGEWRLLSLNTNGTWITGSGEDQ